MQVGFPVWENNWCVQPVECLSHHQQICCSPVKSEIGYKERICKAGFTSVSNFDFLSRVPGRAQVQVSGWTLHPSFIPLWSDSSLRRPLKEATTFSMFVGQLAQSVLNCLLGGISDMPFFVYVPVNPSNNPARGEYKLMYLCLSCPVVSQEKLTILASNCGN